MVNDEGYDSLYAKGGADLRNDEYIIFEGERCTIKYLIEIEG
jgi:poly [ADP-ribose] polymerase